MSRGRGPAPSARAAAATGSIHFPLRFMTPPLSRPTAWACRSPIAKHHRVHDQHDEGNPHRQRQIREDPEPPLDLPRVGIHTVLLELPLPYQLLVFPRLFPLLRPERDPAGGD